MKQTLTPSFWTHKTRPIQFCLVVDNFRVKLHLKTILEQNYKLSTDWTGTKYVGLTIEWDYNKHEVHILMPDYVQQALTCFQHPPRWKLHHQPHLRVLPNYGQNNNLWNRGQHPEPWQETDQIHPRGHQHVLILCMDNWQHQNDSLKTDPDAIIMYHTSNMIIAAHSNVSYLSEPKAQSQAGEHLFMSTNTTFLPNNWAVHNTAQILKHVMSSAVEAELGMLFINSKLTTQLWHTLARMGHLQTPMLVQTDNSTQQDYTVHSKSNGHVIPLPLQPWTLSALSFLLVAR